ncbi:MAG: FtsQ-type POTRA domain-containing protein [Kiritimatiellae bacterium]|nr:FtsQ-type POTRA domain-containing protein [Kiritimatiellia bacterium]
MRKNRKGKPVRLHSAAAKAGRTDRKPLYILLAIAMICAMAAGVYMAYVKLHGLWTAQCAVTDVTKQVSITGNQYTNDGVVLDVLDIKNGANLAKIDFCKAREKALAKIPGIKTMTIQRHLPDRLEITIEERIPVARMNVKGNKRITGRVVDSEGMVFSRQPNTSTLPFIYEDKARATPIGKSLSGRQLAAVRLAEISQEQRFASLGILSIDTTHADFLVAILGNYARANIAWENMDSPTAKTAASLEEQFGNLFSAVKANIARHSSGAASAIVWNATQPGYIYADTKEPIQ